MPLRVPEIEDRIRERALRMLERPVSADTKPAESRTGVFSFEALFWCVVLLLIVLLFLMGLLLGFFLIAIVPPMIFGRIAAQGGWSTDVIFALVSFLAAGIAAARADELICKVRSSKDLAILSHLPVSDEEIVRRHEPALLAGRGMLVLTWCLVFYGTFAYVQQLPAVAAVGVILFGVLQFAVIYALAVALAGFRPARVDQFWNLTFLVVILPSWLVLVITALKLPIVVPHADVLLVAKLLLPTGWINAVVQYGVIRGQPAALCLLAPATLLLLSAPAARERLRRIYRVREIRLVTDSTAEAVFEDERLWRLPSGKDGTEAAQLLDERTARDRVLSGELLSGWDWRKLGWVERAVAAALSRRERDAVELLLSRPPHWTRTMVILTFVAVPAGLLPQLVFGPQAPALFALAPPLALLVASFVRESWNTTWRSRSGMNSPALIQVPISYSEAARAVVMVGAVRALAILPGTVLAGAAAFTGAGFGIWEGALVGVRCAIVYFAAHCWSVSFFREGATSLGSFRIDVMGCVLSVLLFLTFSGSALVFVFPSGEPLATLSAAVMFASGWMAARQAERQFHDPSMDLVADRCPEVTR